MEKNLSLPCIYYVWCYLLSHVDLFYLTPAFLLSEELHLMFLIFWLQICWQWINVWKNIFLHLWYVFFADKILFEGLFPSSTLNMSLSSDLQNFWQVGKKKKLYPYPSLFNMPSFFYWGFGFFSLLFFSIFNMMCVVLWLLGSLFCVYFI